MFYLVKKYFSHLINVSFNSIVVGKKTYVTDRLYVSKNAKVYAGDNVRIRGLYVEGMGRVLISDDCILEEVKIYLNSESPVDVRISKKVFVGSNSLIISYSGLRIEEGTLISPRVTIVDTYHEKKLDGSYFGGRNISDKISIGKNCWLGVNSVILKGVVVGEGTLLAANSVLSESTFGGVYAGAPAKYKKDN